MHTLTNLSERIVSCTISAWILRGGEYPWLLQHYWKASPTSEQSELLIFLLLRPWRWKRMESHREGEVFVLHIAPFRWVFTGHLRCVEHPRGDRKGTGSWLLMGPQFEVDKSLNIVWGMLSFSSMGVLGSISFWGRENRDKDRFRILHSGNRWNYEHWTDHPKGKVPDKEKNLKVSFILKGITALFLNISVPQSHLGGSDG